MIESGYEPIPTTQGYLRENRLGTNVYVVTNTNKVQISIEHFKRAMYSQRRNTASPGCLLSVVTNIYKVQIIDTTFNTRGVLAISNREILLVRDVF